MGALWQIKKIYGNFLSFPFFVLLKMANKGVINKSVSDTGPIIHLTEIDLINSLNIFSEILIPEEVSNELRLSKTSVPKQIKVSGLKPEFKDNVKVLTNQENLDLGEACAIVLAMQEKVNCFLTDDLDARNIAIKYNLEVHGTVGIVLRAFREKIINKKIAIEKVNELHSKSSLFITKDLIDEVINAINIFK
jgi:predicted nucleic acid-binding protein